MLPTRRCTRIAPFRFRDPCLFGTHLVRQPSLSRRRTYTKSTDKRQPQKTQPSTLVNASKQQLLESRSAQQPQDTRDESIDSLTASDKANPPLSTLPPPLTLPSRQDSSSTVTHYFKVGRSYGRFYWAGIKATYKNHQAAKLVRQGLTSHLSAKQLEGVPARLGIFSSDATRLCLAVLSSQLHPTSSSSPTSASRKPVQLTLTRSKFQFLVRDQRDWAKAPVFGLLICLLGEWLPLFVPFFPSLVPRTCRIPSQIEGMRKKAEGRRREVFRSGEGVPSVDTPDAEKIVGQPWLENLTLTGPEIVTNLPSAELVRVSTSLGLHKALWDKVGLSPPRGLLTASVRRHMVYLGVDDQLLSLAGGESALGEAEVANACEERGIDVVGRPTDELRRDLRTWLSVRTGHRGAVDTVRLLFLRPTVWGS